MIDNKLYQYLLDVSLCESHAAAELRAASQAHDYSWMLTPPEQSQFLAFLLQMIQAKRVIEVGVFTGYSTLVMAEALPDDGEIIACDTNEPWVSMGLPFWKAAGVDSKISVCIGSARDTLQGCLDEGQAGSFDFIYVDADKIHYADYLTLGLRLIHAKGLLVFDNVLRLNRKDGAVCDRKIPSTRALDDFNRQLKENKTIKISMLPIGDGLTLVRHATLFNITEI